MEKLWLKNYPKGIPTEVDFGSHSSLFDIYEESVRLFGPKKAFTNMGVSLSFKELNERVNQLASFFQHELKLKKGDRSRALKMKWWTH